DGGHLIARFLRPFLFGATLRLLPPLLVFFDDAMLFGRFGERSESLLQFVLATLYYAALLFDGGDQLLFLEFEIS
ncbi:hypothetical protein WAI99_21745, partial [Acinetobacter baumannii]